MTTRRARGRGLASRMIAFTMIAVATAVVTIGGVSVAGVYNLTRSEDSARLRTYRQLLADDVTARLAIVEHVVDAVDSVEVLRPGPGEPLSRALARFQQANAEYIDLVVLADASGSVQAVSRAGVVGESVERLRAFREGGAKGQPWFSWEPAADPRTGVLWVVRRIDSGPQVGLVLLASVRLQVITGLLGEIALGTPSRTAAIMSRNGDIITSGLSISDLRISEPVFATEKGAESLGTVRWSDPEYGDLNGFYRDLVTVPELGWRVVVLESEQDAMARARAALLPAGFATIVAALVALMSAVVFSRRLVAPLADFERRARDIASGGYVRPMLVDRTDEVGRLADAFNEMGVRLNSLQDVAQLLASAADPDEVLEAVLGAIGHLLGTSDAAVLLAEPGGAELVLVRGRGLREPLLQFSVMLDETSPLTAAFRERRSVSFEGQKTNWAVSVFRLFDAPPDRSGVAVPLSVGEDVLGVVVALSAGSRPLTQAQVETLRAFSAQAAVAVRTSRLFEHEHVSRREAEALREVAELIAGTHDLAGALDRVAAVAASLLGMSDCAVAIDARGSFGLDPADDIDEEDALLSLWREHASGVQHTSSPFEPIVVRAVRSGAVADGDLDSVRTILLVPLARGAEVRGVLALTVPAGGADPSERQVALAGTLGREVSLALDNAALLQEARTRAANLETIFRISQAVSSSLQINVVLNRVLDVVQKIFSADAVSLMAYDPAKRMIDTSMARGLANREMLYLQVAPGDDIPGSVFTTRNPVVHGDLGSLDTPLARLASAQGLRSLLAVPLLARGRSTGVLTVFEHTIDAFTEEDKELLLTFASQAALAIDTASLYGKEHHVASVLQASILPERLPIMSGIETASFYLPAGVDAEIGGDYYDLFATSGGDAVIAIGDVCGKGVQAATKTSMIKYSLRGLVAAGATPGEALAELNRLVAYSGDPADIVTAWIGFLDPTRRSLTYADGGHPPALLLRHGTGVFERLGPTGPLLGAIEGATYDERVVALDPGDLLVTYTDGVTEARRGTRFFGEGRIRRAMRGAISAEAAVESLLGAVGEFSAGVMRDDAAVLGVRIAEEQPLASQQPG
ncbi:MAG: SpoIIE family protein phosphatase [Coriobacteriia bacterium]|nr:SpoIIE family protein phosphatase [Coriobacteriia bacterium]